MSTACTDTVYDEKLVMIFIILANDLMSQEGILDPSHNSHNALDKYSTMHHFVADMYTHVPISVTKWCTMRYRTGALLDLWDGSCGIDNAK